MPRLIIYLLALIITAPAVAQTLERPPYLQMPTTSSMIVRWHTDTATDTDLWWGAAPGTLTGHYYNAAAVTDHEASATGLATGTLYYYSVGYTGTVLAGADVDHHFKTLPAADSTETVRIWWVSDAHHYLNDLRGLLNSYAGMLRFVGDRLPDVILLGGDNAGNAGSSDALYTSNLFVPLASIFRSVPVWAAQGNHDATAVIQSNFTLPTAAEEGGVASGSERYYSFEIGQTHFIALQTFPDTDLAEDGAIDVWWEADLAANTKRWAVVFGHGPIYSAAGLHSDSILASVALRANFLPDADDEGVDLWFAGHEHSMERFWLTQGFYGAEAEWDAGYTVDGGAGDCCDDGAYTKSNASPSLSHEGIVFVTSGSSNMVGHAAGLDGTWDFVNTVTYQYGSLNHTGDGAQGTAIIDIQGGILDYHWIDWRGATKDAFQIRKE